HMDSRLIFQKRIPEFFDLGVPASIFYQKSKQLGIESEYLGGLLAEGIFLVQPVPQIRSDRKKIIPQVSFGRYWQSSGILGRWPQPACHRKPAPWYNALSSCPDLI